MRSFGLQLSNRLLAKRVTYELMWGTDNHLAILAHECERAAPWDEYVLERGRSIRALLQLVSCASLLCVLRERGRKSSDF